MNEPIPEPLRGADIIAWAGPVTRALNSLPGKVGATFRNERDRRGASSPDMGCWKIVVATREEEDEETGDTVSKPIRKFANQFYMDGEYNLAELELDDAVEDFVCQGTLAENEEYTEADRPFVCLKVPATTDATADPTLDGYKTVEELQAAQKEVAYVIKPLYKFTHGGAVAVDFRNCPEFQVSEILP